MKKKLISIITLMMLTSTISVNAAHVPRESAPCNAVEEEIVVTENLIGSILDEVQNGLGYASAAAKARIIIFNAWRDGNTDGYAYGKLIDIANNAIYRYRDMYLRPEFYIENEEKVRNIIAEVITQYANGEIDYNTACFNAQTKIYQSVYPAFDPNEEFSKDSCYRDIPPIDSSLITIAKKLLLEAKG